MRLIDVFQSCEDSGERALYVVDSQLCISTVLIPYITGEQALSLISRFGEVELETVQVPAEERLEVTLGLALVDGVRADRVTLVFVHRLGAVIFAGPSILKLSDAEVIDGFLRQERVGPPCASLLN